KEKIKKKHYTSDLLENIAKETFSKKLALTLSKTGSIDYRNEKIEQQILAFLNSIEEEGQSNIEIMERNTIKQEPELKRKEVIKKEEEKQHTDKDTNKVRQEDRLEPEDEKVYFTIWDLPNRISKSKAEVEWSSMREDIKRKLEANWDLPLKNGQLARIIAGKSS
ncbi:18432_t:CDS:2, partial [Gigaspora margarita]